MSKTLDNELVNTHRYGEFTGVTSTAGVMNISLSSFQANAEENIYGITLFESVTGGTTTTTTSTTTTTTTSTTTTSTTTTSTSTSSTTSTSTSSTSGTTSTTTTTLINPEQAKFNFNLTAQSIPGFVDVSGSPHAGVLTATDTGNSGFTVASIIGKWTDFGASSNNVNGGVGSNADFPSDVFLSYWFTYTTVYASTGAALKISNLLPSTSYTVKIIGSRNGSGISVGNRLVDYHVSQVATVGDASEQAILGHAAKDSLTTETFTITSNPAGEIFVGVSQSAGGNGTNGDQFGYLNGLIVTRV